MNISKRILNASLVAIVAFAPITAHQVIAAEKEKVVIQVSDSENIKWKIALNNAKNVQKILGAENTEIEIVAYGPGIAMLKAGSDVTEGVNQAIKSGIKIVACESTMHSQQLKSTDMNSNISYVPAGVIELMRRQYQGWAYIRP